MNRDENGQAWADVLDLLTINPDARRRVVRVLGEIAAADSPGKNRAYCIQPLLDH